MKNPSHKIISSLFTCLFAFNICLANAQDKQVSFAIGTSLEPYVIHNGKGIILDIIRQSLNESGYAVTFSFFDNKEALKKFQDKQYDAMAVVKPGMVTTHISKPFITFNHHAISLADKKIDISKISELETHSIIAFSNATTYLGQDYSDMARSHTNYVETDSQLNQVDSLFQEKVDIVIMDKTIFEFYQKRLKRTSPKTPHYRKKVAFSYTFESSEYHVAFHNGALKDAFDVGIYHLNEIGRMEKIYNKYMQLLREF